MAEVVVVGAGVGGLAAAARLAAAGHRVNVVEQADRIGGKLGLVERGGFRFDTGPSLLTMPHVLRDTFAAAGADIGDLLALRRVEPVARYRFGDGTWFDSSADLPTMVANLESLSPGSGTEWVRFLGRAGAAWDASRERFLESPLRGMRDLFDRHTRPRDLLAIAPHRTLRSLARRSFRDPRLVSFVDRYATYTGSDPRRAPATLSVIPYVEQVYGAWYVDGGLFRIAEALAATATDRGAVIRTACDVVAIERGAVRLADGGRLSADVVVANADADHLYRDLVRDPRAAGARRSLDRADRSLSGFVLLLGLSGRTAGATHHTVLFPRDYDAEFDDLFGPQAQPVRDPTVYVSVPDDPAVAPPNAEAWFVLVNAPRHGQNGVDWDVPGVAEAYGDKVLSLLAERWTDVRDRIIVRETITPADLERRTRASGGAIYGTSSNGRRAAFLRPANASPVPGLFLVGGSAHPGGGLPLVLLSAKIVARLIGEA